MELSQLGGFLAIGALLAILGKGVTKMVFGSAPKAGRKGWKGVFYVTLWLQPIVAGALIGLCRPLPAPVFIGDKLLGSVIWYALAGGMSPAIYSAFRSAVKHGKLVKGA